MTEKVYDLIPVNKRFMIRWKLRNIPSPWRSHSLHDTEGEAKSALKQARQEIRLTQTH